MKSSSSLKRQPFDLLEQRRKSSLKQPPDFNDSLQRQKEVKIQQTPQLDTIRSNRRSRLMNDSFNLVQLQSIDEISQQNTNMRTSFVSQDGSMSKQKSMPIHKIANFMDEVYDFNSNIKSSKDLFLEHLEQFAERFLTKQKIVIEKYYFDRQDIKDDIFQRQQFDDEQNLDTMQDANKHLDLQNQSQLPSFREYLQKQVQKRAALIGTINALMQKGKQEGAKTYQVDQVLILKDLMPIQDKQRMVVRTWEKSYRLSLDEQKKKWFNLKTIRIFDEFNQEKKSILCEQVIGNINQRFYDCSYIGKGKNIYFFKRINRRHKLDNSVNRGKKRNMSLAKHHERKLDDIQSDDSMEQQSNTSAIQGNLRDEIKNSTPAQDDNSPEISLKVKGTKKHQLLRKQTSHDIKYEAKSDSGSNDLSQSYGSYQYSEGNEESLEQNCSDYAYLQLFKFNIATYQQTQLEEFYINEQVSFDQNQINVIFSQAFGPITKRAFRNDIDFIQSQFVIKQEYMMHNERAKPFKICSMKNPDQNIFSFYERESNVFNKPHWFRYDEKEDCSMTSQIQYAFHTIQKINNKKYLIFILITESTHMHIKFKYPDLILTRDHVVSYNQSQKFLRIHNNIIDLQKFEFQKDDLSILQENWADKSDNEEVYFFVDYRNKIQLVYPNFTNNLTKVEIQKLIEQKMGFEGRDNFHQYKMVWYKDFRHKVNHSSKKGISRNFVQSISHLKAALKMSEIDENQIFSFYRDDDDQILYITRHDSTEITQIQIKDLMCEEAYEQIEEEVGEVVKHQLQRQVLLRFNTSFFSDNIEAEIIQSKKSQTRIKMMVNNYLTHQNIKKTSQEYLNICHDDDENDAIECDINSGKVIIQQKEKAKFYEQHYNSGVFESVIMENHDEEHSYSGRGSDLEIVYKKPSFGSIIRLEDQTDRKIITMKDSEGDLTSFFAYSNEFIYFEQMNLELIQQNDQYYLFIFSLVNYIFGKKKKTYIFVRKSFKFMQKLFSNHKECSSSSSDEFIMEYDHKREHVLIDNIDKVQVLLPNCEFRYITFIQLYNYQYGVEQSNILLTFEKLLDVNVKINFLVIGYQESNNQAMNSMLIYDISLAKVVKKLSINPRQSNLRFMFVDHKGFNNFKFVRTSDVKSYEYESVQGHNILIETIDLLSPEPAVKNSKYSRVIQSLKMTIFTFYIETVGRIQTQEFLIQQHKHAWDEEIADLDHSRDDLEKIYDSMYSIQIIGQKQLFLSNKCILKSNMKYLRFSQPIPFLDKYNKIQGCQFIMKHSQTRKSKINLVDYSDLYGQSQNNMFSYESSLVLVGSKKFELDRIDSEDYILVIGAKLRDDVVRMKIFDIEESLVLLRNMQNMYLQLRKPNLSFILKNDYFSMIKNNFFTTQEILLGKSMCDICLSDPRKINEALRDWTPSEKFEIEGTILYDILENDSLRRDYLEQMKFVPTRTIISLDFNYNTSIYRGLMLRNLESVRILLNYMVQYKASNVYNDMLMLDLKYILKEKTIKIHDYFKESTKEKKSVERKLQAGNIEQLITDNNVDKFSHLPMQYMSLDKRTSTIKVENQVIEQIQQRAQQFKEEQENDKWKEWKIIEKYRGERTMYPVEHKFIDFKMMVIREKVKFIAHKDTDKQIHIDETFEDITDRVEQGNAESMGITDEVLAQLMMAQSHDINFYLQESVQKLIDFQFETQTRRFMKGILWFYIITFIVPYFSSLIVEDQTAVLILLIICCLAQIFLLLIECIQMRDNGIDYVKGWNLIDFGQLVLFWIMFQEKLGDVWGPQEEEDFNISVLIQLLLILFSILKVVHFIAVYHQFGFFIKMLTICLHDLIPFIINYIIFLNFFAILYATLGVEIHDELNLSIDNHAAIEYMGYYGMLIVTVYRNSVGKLGYAKYTMLIKDDRADLYPTIYTIWIVYFFQILITLIIGLNFMIAIIEQTFANQNELKEGNLYRNKAELNQECAEILKYFMEPKEIRIIIFTKFEIVKSDSIQQAKEIVHGKDDETNYLLKRLEQGVIEYGKTINEKLKVLDDLDKIIQKQQGFMAREDEQIQDYQNGNEDVCQELKQSMDQVLISVHEEDDNGDMDENLMQKIQGMDKSINSVESEPVFKDTFSELNKKTANDFKNKQDRERQFSQRYLQTEQNSLGIDTSFNNDLSPNNNSQLLPRHKKRQSSSFHK